MCKDYVKNGLPFNPYKDEQQQAAQQSQTAPQTAYTPENGQVLTMGGKSPKNLMYDGYVEAGRNNRIPKRCKGRQLRDIYLIVDVA
ncbi:phage associated protein [Neisseria meningitidis]|nr:phage associated protein [Neisseria meningitidis]